MFICMAGLPSSGKSEFVKKFQEISKQDIKVVDPKEYVPEDIDDLSEEDQRKWRVAAWEVCLEQVKNLFHEPNEKIIIFDTAASSNLAIEDLFTFAKVKGHYIVYIFIASKISECKERTKNWISDETAQRYLQKYKLSVPQLIDLSDEHLLVKNMKTKGLENIEKAAGQLEAITTQHAEAS